MAGLWLAGEVVNHVGIYGSKAAEGLSAFQRRSCLKLIWKLQKPIINMSIFKKLDVWLVSPLCHHCVKINTFSSNLFDHYRVDMKRKSSPNTLIMQKFSACKMLLCAYVIPATVTLWSVVKPMPSYAIISSSLQCGNAILNHGPLTKYAKLWVAHASGMPGKFSPPLRFSGPGMRHGTCVTHVPWCMPGSLTSGFLWSRWREKRSRHSRRMGNPQFCVSGKRPMISCPISTVVWPNKVGW